MHTKPDYSTWLTKQQAADAIGVSTKQIEPWTQEKAPAGREMETVGPAFHLV
jgi:hypothetical protein